MTSSCKTGKYNAYFKLLELGEFINIRYVICLACLFESNWSLITEKKKRKYTNNPVSVRIY